MSTTETLDKKSSLKRIGKVMLKFWAVCVHPETKEELNKSGEMQFVSSRLPFLS